MDSCGHVRVLHQDGLCVFEIACAALRISDRELDLSIETSENGQCHLGVLGPPALHIESADVSTANLAELEQEVLSVATGWDTDEETKDGNIFRICFGEHYALDNNCVSIVRRGPDTIEVTWRADAADFNYYDQRAKRNAVEARLTFVGQKLCPFCHSLWANAESKYCPYCERHFDNDTGES